MLGLTGEETDARNGNNDYDGAGVTGPAFAVGVRDVNPCGAPAWGVNYVRMSPTVFRAKGFRFFFFSREEPRMHVHVHGEKRRSEVLDGTKH